MLSSRSLLLVPLLALTGCNRDPRVAALEEAVDLMAGIVRSNVLVNAVRNADPQMRATSAAGSALRAGVVASFPMPPRGVAIVEGDKATRPWCVVLVGDDALKQVRIEGYAEDLTKPAIVERVGFPP
jgi:hypothetical protein